MSLLAKLFESYKKPQPAKSKNDISSNIDASQVSKEVGTKELIQENKDFGLLVELRKRFSDTVVDGPALVMQINLNAKNNTCPYCSAIFDFTASRARKCPSCLKKMVVRSGYFLTEEQVSQFDKLRQFEWMRQDFLQRLGYALQYVQDLKLQKNFSNFYLQMGEAFSFAAQIQNQKDEKGFSFWDKAWGYYNHARMIAMNQLKSDEFDKYTELPNICWKMTESLFNEANQQTILERKERGMKRALNQSFMVLAEASQFEIELYFISDLYKLAKKIILDLNISDDEIINMAESIVVRNQLTPNRLKNYQSKIDDLMKYQLIEV